jgi:hypothetical protein
MKKECKSKNVCKLRWMECKFASGEEKRKKRLGIIWGAVLNFIVRRVLPQWIIHSCGFYMVLMRSRLGCHEPYRDSALELYLVLYFCVAAVNVETGTIALPACIHSELVLRAL